MGKGMQKEGIEESFLRLLRFEQSPNFANSKPNEMIRTTVQRKLNKFVTIRATKYTIRPFSIIISLQ